MDRKCEDCGELKSLSPDNFRLYNSGYYSRKCRGCLRIHRKKYLQNPEARRKFNATRRRSNLNLKYLVFDHYGGECACCGEKNYKFLTIDHINGEGRKHRESIKSGMKSGGSYFYRWIRDNEYPNYLQVLCYNCNCGRNTNGGVCPHTE
jgi:hypothetical protein